MRKHLCKQLKSRNEGVLDEWPHDTRELAIKMAGMIQEYLEWPNAFFVPRDPCDILLWDTTSELRIEELFMCFKDMSFDLDIDFVLSLNLGQFIEELRRVKT